MLLQLRKHLRATGQHLNLSEEYLLSEDENGLGTAYNYRMRWIRTELKKEGKIINIKRGIWRIA